MKEDIAIKVENVSKQYRLGVLGTGTLSHDINRWWHLVRGKEDPYLKVGENNDRSTKGDSEYVWALKDINFEVKRGEVLGIIGKNGAGKSTLLKILSKVTSPTEGKITMKGRVASLLEVGTGFHPELTGRENIFLNGAILGMTKKEITSKLDEIVEFSGCERYVDTPVKRYSSGMKVRLAFAVAAFLEPEILIVDEVLAVGDDEFQKKAIGKMQDVSQGHGRTVLFVSHNLTAVQQICTKAILIENGTIAKSGTTEAIISAYLNRNNQSSLWKLEDFSNVLKNDFFELKEIYLEDQNFENKNRILGPYDKFIYLNIGGYLKKIDSRLCIGFNIIDKHGNIIISNKNMDSYPEDTQSLSLGYLKFRIKIDISYFTEGTYVINFNLGLLGIKMIQSSESGVSLSFLLEGVKGNPSYLHNNRNAIISPYFIWELN